MVVKALLVLALLCASCIDAGHECQQVIDRNKGELEDEIAAKVTASVAEALPIAVSLEMAKFGCMSADGGTWNCSGSTICGTK